METVDEVEIKYKCTVCDLDLDSSTVIETDSGQPVCETCSVICMRCDSVQHMNDIYGNVDGERWCEPCIDSYAAYCDLCDKYFTGHRYGAEDTGMTFCESCFEGNVSYCEDCDNYYYEGCSYSHEDEEDSRLIHDYSYRPDPIFRSSEDENTRLYFGIEVETEVRGGSFDDRKYAAEYAVKLEQYNLAYLKSDGSLECGFEIVSHPMTHNYFMKDASMLWETISTLKSNYNMMAWGTKTCGLHVHISRAGFNGGSHQHRFLQLVYNNKDFYEVLAGRSSSHWAKFDDNVDPSTGRKSFKHKFDRHGSDRYSAVNTNNRQTLEMRIFRGSINPRFIKSAIDLAHASVEFTRVMSVKEVREGGLSCLNFRQYIESKSELYPSLNDRIKIHKDVLIRIERKEHVSTSSKFPE
jgi:DNA-dependent RNA polymerase auxiliary subunit epsilon